MRLIALKPNTYGTRRLQAGEQFDMPDPYANTLLIMGLAKRVAFINDEEVEQLRAAARAVGIDVDKRWGPRRLRAEIEAKQKWGS